MLTIQKIAGGLWGVVETKTGAELCQIDKTALTELQQKQGIASHTNITYKRAKSIAKIYLSSCHGDCAAKILQIGIKLPSKCINTVYNMLKEREIHPDGTFDSGGRWYSENADLINVRSPSRSWPYSQMQACRTKKYVRMVAIKFECKTADDLLAHV